MISKNTTKVNPRAPKIQCHLECLRIIDDFGKVMRGTFVKNKSPINDIRASLHTEKKNFSVNFEYNRFSNSTKTLDVGQYYKQVQFNSKNYNLVFENLFLGNHAPPYFKGSISFFHTKGFSKRVRYYFRLIIPLKKELRFHYNIGECFFETDLGYHSRTGTKASIADDDLFISVINRKNKKRTDYYLAIESRKKQPFQTFSQKVFAIKNALGYLTGHLPGDGGYYFAYTTLKMDAPKHCYRCEFRNTIISSYTPVYSNPFGYLHSKKKLANRYYKQRILRPLYIEEFSSLCQKIYDSTEFASTILLILESSVATLLFMPGGYAIALEQLSPLILNDRKSHIAPIKDKNIAKNIRQSMNKIVDTEAAVSPNHDWKTIRTRIEQINQATNKAKLQAPFSALGLDLTEEDNKTLETRNDFLHGRVPDITSAGTDRKLDRINRDLYYAAMRLYTLLNLLILKWIGYDNYILNYPKIYETYCKMKINEEYYRKV